MRSSVDVDNKHNEKVVFIRRSEGIEVRSIDDEILVIDEVAGVIFNLNPTGAAVWKLLESPTSCEQIVAVLTTAFPEISEQQIVKDVQVILKQLEEKGLVGSPD